MAARGFPSNPVTVWLWVFIQGNQGQVFHTEVQYDDLLVENLRSLWLQGLADSSIDHMATDTNPTQICCFLVFGIFFAFWPLCLFALLINGVTMLEIIKQYKNDLKVSAPSPHSMEMLVICPSHFVLSSII